MNEIEILKHFLEYPTWTSKPIFEEFKKIENAIFREKNENGKERFLFVEGKREKKVVLIAHADTYFDEYYKKDKHQKHFIESQGDFYIGKSETGKRIALGADDRAGCTILWVLRDSGHSILITDGEEHGNIGSNWLVNENSDIAKSINQHQFMIQFDRRNSSDFKCYNVGTDEFRAFIEEKTNYSEPDTGSSTDICTLCHEICGVNFSVGYYNEHTDDEKINFKEWFNTLNMVKQLLNHDLPRFKK